MPFFRDAILGGTPPGPVSPFRAEAERHRRFLAGRIAALRPAPEATEPGAGPLVLLVEDDEGTSAALEALLADSGYRVAATCLGEEAVRMALELRPDVVLLDLVLPRSSGLETVSILKEQDGTGAIPVVAMTGLWLGDQPEVLASAGFDGSLRKPYTAAQLFVELERVLAPAAEEGEGGWPARRPRRSQGQLPGLAHQVVPEAVVRLLVHQPEAGLLVDAPRGAQHVVGPQRDRAVARPPARSATHSSTSRRPIPSPRAAGSTSSRRSFATSSDCLHQEHRAHRRAVRSRRSSSARARGRAARPKSATISATSASKRSSQPYSRA